MEEVDPILPLAERRIRKAMQEGAFDDLPGRGKPIPDLDGTYDPLWWVKKWIEREDLSREELLALLDRIKDAR